MSGSGNPYIIEQEAKIKTLEARIHNLELLLVSTCFTLATEVPRHKGATLKDLLVAYTEASRAHDAGFLTTKEYK